MRPDQKKDKEKSTFSSLSNSCGLVGMTTADLRKDPCAGIFCHLKKNIRN